LPQKSTKLTERNVSGVPPSACDPHSNKDLPTRLKSNVHPGNLTETTNSGGNDSKVSISFFRNAKNKAQSESEGILQSTTSVDSINISGINLSDGREQACGEFWDEDHLSPNITISSASFKTPVESQLFEVETSYETNQYSEENGAEVPSNPFSLLCEDDGKLPTRQETSECPADAKNSTTQSSIYAKITEKCHLGSTGGPLAQLQYYQSNFFDELGDNSDSASDTSEMDSYYLDAKLDIDMNESPTIPLINIFMGECDHNDALSLKGSCELDTWKGEQTSSVSASDSNGLTDMVPSNQSFIPSWTLHTKMSFQSTIPFGWAAPALSQHDIWTQGDRFGKMLRDGKPDGFDPSLALDSMLLFYSFPANGDAAVPIRIGKSFLSAWKSAISSAEGYARSHDAYYYVRHSQFSALLYQQQALICRCSRGLRLQLRSIGIEVRDTRPFKAPSVLPRNYFVPDDPDTPHDDSNLNMSKEHFELEENDRELSTAIVPNSSYPKFLLFLSELDSWLEKGSRASTTDFPVLLSPFPFLHGTLQKSMVHRFSVVIYVKLPPLIFPVLLFRLFAPELSTQAVDLDIIDSK
jgi:hypothetical protein